MIMAMNISATAVMMISTRDGDDDDFLDDDGDVNSDDFLSP